MALLGGLAAKAIFDQAQEVRAHLAAAQPQLQQVATSVLAADPEGARPAAQAFATETRQASDAASGVLWDIVAGMPIGLSENLRAVKAAAVAADELATDAVVPISEVDISRLMPQDGRIDPTAITELSDLVSRVDGALTDAKETLAPIDRRALLGEVAAGVEQLDDSIETAAAMIGPTQKVLALLPAALGADRPRNYLLMFQGNSEARASGGNPAAMTLLHVEDGRIEIARQATSIQFANRRPESIVPLDAETENIYSDIIGRWVPNMTATPHFPTTANIALGWWADEFDDDIDAVISFDPVGLSYLLRATGPLPVAGETLTAENAAPLLLHDAYIKYPYGPDADEFFASVMVTVFNALTSGTAAPKGLIDGLVLAADAGRLKVWSRNEAETAALADTPLSGTLPADNKEQTVIGAYFNDTTGSKMDYFVDANVAVSTDQCTSAGPPRWKTTVTLQNQISREDAKDLPLYITGPHYTPGDIATDFVVYSPVGARIESWTVNGAKQDAVSHGTHLGRDVLRVSIVTPPLESRVLELTMVGEPGVPGLDYGPLSVRHTPMVRAAGVEIEATGCSAR